MIEQIPVTVDQFLRVTSISAVRKATGRDFLRDPSIFTSSFSVSIFKIVGKPSAFEQFRSDSMNEIAVYTTFDTEEDG